MSQEEFDSLVKRMLDFGNPSVDPTPEESVGIPLQQGKINDITLSQTKPSVQTTLPRKERRAQERVAKRLEKLKKQNTRKEDIANDTKLKLEQVKDETRKSVFTDQDRTRIERVLYNKTN